MVPTAFFIPHPVPGLLDYWVPLPLPFLFRKGRCSQLGRLGNTTQKETEQQGGLVSLCLWINLRAICMCVCVCVCWGVG